jgi:hypothetical protein
MDKRQTQSALASSISARMSARPPGSGPKVDRGGYRHSAAMSRDSTRLLSQDLTEMNGLRAGRDQVVRG